MTTHDSSDSISQHLCDHVLTSLENTLGPVGRTKKPSVCLLGTKPKFAFVYHEASSIRIYLRSKVEDEVHLRSLVPLASGLILVGRKTLDNKGTPYYFVVRSDSDIQSALPWLHYAEEHARRTCSYPPELDAAKMVEGGKTSVYVNRYERSIKARQLCIQIFGCICAVCDFDFAKVYKDIGAGFIHVHHLTPLSRITANYRVNPKKDLRPVCPNCHEMLHRQTPPFSIDELRAIIANSQNP